MVEFPLTSVGVLGGVRRPKGLSERGVPEPTCGDMTFHMSTRAGNDETSMAIGLLFPRSVSGISECLFRATSWQMGLGGETAANTPCPRLGCSSRLLGRPSEPLIATKLQPP